VIKILIVDDSALVRKLFGQVFATESDFEVSYARNGLEALAQLETFRPDVITLDVYMPHMNGLACLDRIMIERPCPVVMVSALTAEGADETLAALRLGAVDFIAKPEGAVSLHMERFAPMLIAKTRAAASAKIRASQRLRERVRHHSLGLETADERWPAKHTGPRKNAPAHGGNGLILIGISTGGPPALEEVLSALPQDFPWPVLVAQHMPASFTGSLAKRLDALCAVRVVEVLRPTPVEPGFVYIGRGDADMIVAPRAAGLVVMSAPQQSKYPWHPSTERLVRSAMEHVAPELLVGVLMTGMGDDGVAAMLELRARGGRTVAEAEETAIVWGMPGELVKAGGADWIVPLPRIAEQLGRMVRNNAASS
jgi:two-component system chemotaxis response regulator CheB